jgi:uncharacterized protein YndB with AHSA1/START domain
MIIRTSTVIPSSSERLWPLLTNSRMTKDWHFCPGVPRPVACELPSSEGKVGAERRCISDRGTVIQTITHWEPPKHLIFRMASTDHWWGRCMESIEENFTLESTFAGTRITRSTHIAAKGRMKRLKELLFSLGIKRVHLYVFQNWRSQS